MKFEFIMGKKVFDRCEVITCQCRNENHKVRMSNEEAIQRGIGDRWQEDDNGGFIWEISKTVVLPSELKISVPRAGKKAEVLKCKTLIIRCLDCGQSEEICLSDTTARIAQIASI